MTSASPANSGRLAHVGISVPDLDRSLAFYCEGLGLTLDNRKVVGGPYYDAMFGVPGIRGRAATVSGRNIEIELFEFEHPAPPPTEPVRPICNYGLSHFCIEVDNLEETWSRLKTFGASSHGEPIKFPIGATALYMRDIDGNIIELLQPKK